MSRTWRCVVGSAVAVAGAAVLGYAAPPLSAAVELESESVRAVLDGYCIACHNQRLQTAGLALDAMDPARVGDHAAAWEQVVRKLRTGAMPPAGRPRPEPAAYAAVASTLETALDRVAAADPNPGPHHRPPPEPAGVRQRGTRPADARDRRRGPAARRQRGPRLRQHGRHPLGVAGPARPLHLRGAAHQPARRRRPRHRADDRDLGPALDAVPGPPHERGPAVRVARGHFHPARLPPRRRVRRPHPAAAPALRLRARPPEPAAARGAAGRRARRRVHHRRRPRHPAPAHVRGRGARRPRVGKSTRCTPTTTSRCASRPERGRGCSASRSCRDGRSATACCSRGRPARCSPSPSAGARRRRRPRRPSTGSASPAPSTRPVPGRRRAGTASSCAGPAPRPTRSRARGRSSRPSRGARGAGR